MFVFVSVIQYLAGGLPESLTVYLNHDRAVWFISIVPKRLHIYINNQLQWNFCVIVCIPTHLFSPLRRQPFGGGGIMLHVGYVSLRALSAVPVMQSPEADQKLYKRVRILSFLCDVDVQK